VSLRRILRRERIALVHAHCPNSGVPIMNAARGLKLPLVAHVHDLDQRWVTHRTLRVQNRARSVVVGISDAAVRYAVERGVEPSHTRRIYNGVHLPAGAPDARAGAREALGIADGEVAVGLVGRLVPRKGQRDLVQAMADPRTRELPLRAYLVGAPERGDTTFEPALRTLAAELGVSHRVRFVGPRDDAPALMAGFDIVAVPSFREAFGRVVVESMHAGTPVVVYRDAALPELVHHEVDGLIVPAGDVAALAAALARLASDPALRDQLAANGRIRARDFSHERFVAEVTALYRELLAD
jgi:glycosyltransferase involved in cell wall biosynthesis